MSILPLSYIPGHFYSVLRRCAAVFQAGLTKIVLCEPPIGTSLRLGLQARALHLEPSVSLSLRTDWRTNEMVRRLRELAVVPEDHPLPVCSITACISTPRDLTACQGFCSRTYTNKQTNKDESGKDDEVLILCCYLLNV